MNKHNYKIKILLQRYISEEASNKEVNELFAWIRKHGHLEELTAFLKELLEETPPYEYYDEARWDILIRQIVQQGTVATTKAPSQGTQSAQLRKSRTTYFLWPQMAAAVFVLCVMSFTAYLHFVRNTGPQLSNTVDISVRYKNDVQPGTNKAILTLGDNSTIVLDEAHDGDLARQGNTRVRKLFNGMLAYDAGFAEPTQVLYNTVTTPRGGQYQVTLPDGTLVWLNAASSLRFPTVFHGNKREVIVTGEVYFEVTRNLEKPFLVHIFFPEGDHREGTIVEVIGTNFNVMAYEDETTFNTTLLEGSVRLVPPDLEAVMIEPGHQVQLNRNNEFEIMPADQHATVWKEGMFEFKDHEIQTIMRQVARWYDLEVVYSGQPTADTFTGKISRSLNLSQLLKILEISEVRFTIDGKKVTVLP